MDLARSISRSREQVRGHRDACEGAGTSCVTEEETGSQSRGPLPNAPQLTSWMSATMDRFHPLFTATETASVILQRTFFLSSQFCLSLGVISFTDAKAGAGSLKPRSYASGQAEAVGPDCRAARLPTPRSGHQVASRGLVFFSSLSFSSFLWPPPFTFNVDHA